MQQISNELLIYLTFNSESKLESNLGFDLLRLALGNLSKNDRREPLPLT